MKDIHGFKFVDDYIYFNRLDGKYILSVLAAYKKMVDSFGKLDNDPIQKIEGFWDYSDSELEGYLKELEKNLLDGKYSTALYSKIILLIIKLETYDVFKNYTDQIIEAMKQNIENADSEDIQELSFDYFFLEENEVQQYNRYNEELALLIKERKKISEKEMYAEAIDDINRWGTNLLEIACKREIRYDHSFVYWISPNEIIKRIISSNNDELNRFRRSLPYIYSDYSYFHNQEDDLENLTQLKDLLDSNEKIRSQQIKRAIVRLLINDIEAYIDRIVSDDNK